ncbi:hypothetical protein BDR26DRAFT_873340 [Obelidium mucronatum]|nr:hypothetical protein BDR26DRAFT_873340 [Obelidium mucronatum]
MFWSGGKDSFLALTHTMQRINPTTTQIVLLTTIDPETNKVPIQNVSVPDICAQASALNLPLLLAPRGPNAGNETYIQTVTAALFTHHSPKIKFLVFGDLFLQDIRSWREASFGSLVPCRFPLFGLDYKSVLLPRLWSLCEEFEIKIQFAVFEKEEFRFWVESVVEKGDEDDGGARSWPYTKELLERSDFPENVDLMGERGEFHTLVQFLDMWDKE